MNALAGLDQFSEGSMVMENKEISGPGLERGVVFQNYSLLPWLTAGKCSFRRTRPLESVERS